MALVVPALLASLLLAGLAAPGRLAAQEDTLPGEPAPTDTLPAEPAPTDTLPAEAAPSDTLVSPIMMPRTPGGAAADSADIDTGPSPMSAFFRSVLIPGWGQLAADQPVRAAFYFTMQSATIFMVFRTQSRIEDAEDAEAPFLASARREQLEDWLVLAGFWALASGIDAWVSAHMWGFEGEVVPPPDGSAGVALRVRVPVEGF